MICKVALVLAALGTLTACAPQQYESEPVAVSTPQGPVTCQFYLPTIVLWDTPLSYPAAMTKEEAVSVCRTEGMARKQG